MPALPAMLPSILKPRRVSHYSSTDFKFPVVRLTRLAKTIGLMTLSLMALPAIAATSTPVVNSSMTNSAEMNASSVNYGVISTNLFLECATLQSGAARLVCYDKVTQGGNSTVVKPKKPLDLFKTVMARQAVLATDDVTDSRTPESAVLAKVGASVADVQSHTLLSRAYDLDKNNEAGVWSPRPYNPIYMLPLFVGFDRNKTPETPTQKEYKYTSNEYRAFELKAQVSVKTKAVEDLFNTNADLWIGYTQQMHWQVYNEDNSRPFRANDYMPEVFLTQPVKADLPFGGYLRMLGAGAVHHSNGQDDPLSRSWNRLYVMGGAEWKRLTIIPKAWVHIKNDSGDGNDNPDITDYYGHGEIQALYNFGLGHTLGATGRYNVGHGKGGIQIDYTRPIANDALGYIQLFHGYGESIIDYNHKSTSIGVGIMLSDWKNL